MDLNKIDELIATKVMDWEKKNLPNNDEGDWRFTASYWVDDQGEKQRPVNFFDPSRNLIQAWRVAEKMGLALIPQSNGDGFNWFACDVESVSYRGDEIAIIPIEDSGWSKPTAPLAICFAALESVGVEIGKDDE